MIMKQLNKKNGPIFGMVHCLPLIGTANFKNNMQEIIKQAVNDALTLEKAGIDAVIVENTGDNPLGVTMDLEQSIALATVSALVKDKVKIPLGIDAAFNDYKTSLATAKAIGADFVRIPVFVDTVLSHNGIVSPCAREAMLYRKKIQAENVKIFADIQVKHAHMVVSTITLEESAKLAESMGADALIVTGTSTGFETPIDAIKKVKEVVSIPIIVGSGINETNVSQQMEIANGAIVGSSLKENKNLLNPISYELTKNLIKKYRGDEIK